MINNPHTFMPMVEVRRKLLQFENGRWMDNPYGALVYLLDNLQAIQEQGDIDVNYVETKLDDIARENQQTQDKFDDAEDRIALYEKNMADLYDEITSFERQFTAFWDKVRGILDEDIGEK